MRKAHGQKNTDRGYPLPDDSLLLQPRFRRYAIACRKLPELVRLRSSFLGRAIHTTPAAWQKQSESYLAEA
jgi:hypothetical protein